MHLINWSVETSTKHSFGAPVYDSSDVFSYRELVNSSLEDVAGKSDASRSLRDPFGRHGEVVVDLDSLGDAGEGGRCVARVET